MPGITPVGCIKPQAAITDSSVTEGCILALGLLASVQSYGVHFVEKLRAFSIVNVLQQGTPNDAHTSGM